MNYKNLTAPGDIIHPQELAIAKAQDIVNYLELELSPYSKFVECRRDGENEVIVLEVEVEVGQITKNDIQNEETIAVTFYKDDNYMPEVVALRDNFPRVPHINLRTTEFPRSLCLFDRPYDELKIRWTASLLIERIREWLALTAKGILHAEDQPLEPLLMGSGIPLILPHDLFSEEEYQSSTIDIYKSENPDGRLVLIARKNKHSKSEIQYNAIAIKFPAQSHGLINYNPHNLEELQKLVSSTKYNLKQELSKHLDTLKLDQKNLDLPLVIIACFPQLRDGNKSIEATDIWAFLTKKNIANIGEDLDIWELYEQKDNFGNFTKTPGIVFSPDKNKMGKDIELYILNPTFSLSREKAASINNVILEKEKQIVAIGAGALGSPIIINSIRAGYGNWTIVDKDYLLPHNLARHEFYRLNIGYSKSHSLKCYSEQILDERNITTAIMDDVIKPIKEEENLNKAYKEADIILDMSASRAVSTHITFKIQSKARRISIFLNPSGTDLVILAEDANREERLDSLEMQYYQQLIENNKLTKHLLVNDTYHRYARSCSDLSNRIPYDFVSIHSGIASRILRDIIKKNESFIGIWSINENDLSIASYKIAVSKSFIPIISERYNSKEWKIITSEKLINRIVSLRKSKLPNETGGVLVGTYDFEQKIIHVVETIDSPSDSIEKPKMYIRGREGLGDILETYSRKTSGILEYIGEWHSHPDNFDPSPSEDDHELFKYMKNHLRVNSQPTLMLVAGSNKNICWLLDGE